jgi:hypothetical protein
VIQTCGQNIKPIFLEIQTLYIQMAKKQWELWKEKNQIGYALKSQVPKQKVNSMEADNICNCMQWTTRYLTSNEFMKNALISYEVMNYKVFIR